MAALTRKLQPEPEHPPAVVGALLEREREIAVLAGHLDAASDGNGCIVVLEGAAGVGKTSLLGELTRRAQAEGVGVLTARASTLEQAFPFAVVRQLFERQASDPDQGAELLAGAARLSEPVLAMRPVAEAAPWSEESFRALHGLYWLVVNLCERRPLLLAVDDAHWCDEASLRFLSYLAVRLEGLPTLVALAVRSGERQQHAGLIDALARDSVARLRLAPLSEAAVATLVRGQAPRASDELCAACHDATRGNPFYVRELLRALVHEGREDAGALAAEVRGLGPGTIARSVFVRLGATATTTIALVEPLAVLGDDADAQLAAELASVAPEQVERALDELVAAEIIVAGPTACFVHPIVREAIYNEIPTQRRARLHAACAAALGDRGATPERIAVHVLRAAPGSVDDAVPILRAAAADARRRGAPGAAVALLERALEEPLDGDARAITLHELGGARVAAFDASGVEELSSAVGLTRDPATRAERALLAAREVMVLGYSDEAAAIADLALSGDACDIDRALTARLLMEARGAQANPATARAAERHHERLQTMDVAPELQPLLDVDRATMLSLAGEDHECVVALVEGAFAGGLLLEPESLALPWALLCLVWADRLGALRSMMDAALALAQEAGAAHRAASARQFRAFASLQEGDILSAEADALAVIEADADHLQARDVPVAPSIAVVALVEQGRGPAAEALLEDAGLDGPLPDTWRHSLLLTGRARLRTEAGRVAEAIADLRQCGATLEAIGMVNPACSPWRSQLAHLLARTGERERARALVGDQLERARAYGAPRALGVALRDSALLGDERVDVDLLCESVAVLASAPARLEHARSQLELGRALRHRGQRAAAREHLRAALDIAQRSAAAPLAAQAREELVVAGARPRREQLSGVAALTAAERRVAELAAAGLTNREIAERLFVTIRTVTTHLTHAYQKLDISSRGELAPALGHQSSGGALSA
jgi:DNA-binding CsgD family transcriptional regulator